MKALETHRLILRTWQEDDINAVQAYASVMENVRFMIWGPNKEEDTRAFISRSIEASKKVPVTDYQYAVVLKETNIPIGGCGITYTGNEAEGMVGWVLHRDYWKQGLGTELAGELIRFGFEELSLFRICAFCDAENYGSYRVMERNGMRREAHFKENRIIRGQRRDEYHYAILRDEWETRREIAYYNSMPCHFDGFVDIPQMGDGVIYLVCTQKRPAEPERGYVPSYDFAICKGGEQVGNINLRIGYCEGLYYGGQVGYNVREQFRGNGYAGMACRLLLPVARAHGMKKLLITNNHTNYASMRVCEKLGARLVRVARLPEWHDLYKDGQRLDNIFEWSAE